MQYSLEIIILIIVFVILFIVTFLIFKNREKILKQEIDRLKNTIDLKDNIIHKYKNEIESENIHISSSSFVSEQLEKIKSLENEILQQKKMLHNAKIIAQDANMVKYDFLSNIRHEIRTPLNSILTFANILKEEIRDTKLLSYAENIYKSGRKMLDLMDEIIELSKMESGSFELNENAVDIKMVFQSIFSEYRHSALQKRLDISLKIDENLPTILILDDEKLKDIVSNLVSNAIKFTDTGYIKINVYANNINDSKNTLSLYVVVEDSGVGIDESGIEQIFEIFEKKDNATSVEYQSVGLGLSINKKMAKLMHGDIYVKSTLSKGSIFTLAIDDVEIALINSKDLDEQDIDFSLVSAKSSNIMVIDEDIVSSEVIKQSFEDTSIRVFSFKNLRESMVAFNEYKFDLIFIDADVLVADDNAVFKVISNISDAPIVSLLEGRVKDVSFENDSRNIIGHLKKPILIGELFKLSIKVLNSSAYMEIIEKMSDSEDDIDLLDINKVRAFLLLQAKTIKPLYEKALLTNDLNAMKKFSLELLSLSKKQGITPFIEYANLFLEKIDLFDIETINNLMKEYEPIVKKLQRLNKKTV